MQDGIILGLILEWTTSTVNHNINGHIGVNLTSLPLVTFWHASNFGLAYYLTLEQLSFRPVVLAAIFDTAPYL